MNRRSILLGGTAATIIAGIVVGGVAVSQAAVAPQATPKFAVPGGAPYIFTDVSGAKDPANVMKTTGVRAFTIAFILNKGNCSPVWDSGSLNDSSKTDRINAIREAGGDVVVSFGG